MIVVDWTDLASFDFFSAREHGREFVARAIKHVIEGIYRTYETTLDGWTFPAFLRLFWMIGHSLGGQISGLVGSLFQPGGKIGLIIGADTARPGFEPKSTQFHYLNQADALWVVMIHTSKMGMISMTGHLNIYINGRENIVPASAEYSHKRVVNIIRVMLEKHFEEAPIDAMVCDNRETNTISTSKEYYTFPLNVPEDGKRLPVKEPIFWYVHTIPDDPEPNPEFHRLCSQFKFKEYVRGPVHLRDVILT